MPFKSEAQRRFMYATDPEMAKKLEKDTPKGTQLSYHREKKAEQMFTEYLLKAAEHESPEFTPNSDLSFSLEDTHIAKYAGIQLYDTTPEGIEDFVRNYILNEISFFPQKVSVKVEFIPEYDPGETTNPEQVVNGTGTASISYAGATIQLPFLIRDKQMVPFDIIQLGQERAVYTRDNLRKVLMGLQASAGAQMVPGATQNGGLSGYSGVGDRVNPATDTGYMQDVLRVQDQAGNTPGRGGNWATASEKIDEFLDKTANFKAVNIDYEAMRVKIIGEVSKELNKIAEIEQPTTLQDALAKVAVFDRVDKLRFINIHHLPNGSHIKFPEKDNGSFSMTNATVYKGVFNFQGVDDLRVMVLSHDGRFADINDFSPFIGIATDNQTLNKPVPQDNLRNGNMYMFVIEGIASAPFYVEGVALTRSKFDTLMTYVYNCTSIDGLKFQLVDMHNPTTKLLKFSKPRFMQEVRKAEQPEKVRYYEALIRKDRPIFVIPDKGIDIYNVKGAISDYMSNPRDLLYMYDDDFLKTASLTDYVSLTQTSNMEPKTYDLDICWTDKRSSRYDTKKRNFKNIPEGQARGILKAIGFSFNETAEIIHRANKEGKGVKELTAAHTPWLVRGDVAAPSIADTYIKKLKDLVFNKNNAGDLVGGILGGGAGSAMDEDSSARGIASWASESEALSTKLEKVAYLKQSEGILKVAKLMAIKHNIDKVVADAYNHNKEYEGVKEVLANLNELEPAIQETVGDLIELKVAQYVNKNEIVSPNVIQATIAHLDGLHKYAAYGYPYVDDNYQVQKPGMLDTAVDFVKEHPIATAAIGLAGYHGIGKIKQSMVPVVPPTKSERFLQSAKNVGKGVGILGVGAAGLAGGAALGYGMMEH